MGKVVRTGSMVGFLFFNWDRQRQWCRQGYGRWVGDLTDGFDEVRTVEGLGDGMEMG